MSAPAAPHLPAPLPFPPLSLFENKEHTVSHALAQNSHLSPKKAALKLFPKPWFFKRFYRRFYIKYDLIHGREWTQDELDQAAQRGDFPRRPSDLFLKMYADVLMCLTRDPLAGVVSPALLGTSGTIPLSIVSTIPDIMRHYADCIVLAEKEVFLVTNYWQPSDSVNAIAGALLDLNERITKRNGQKIVVKVMWDRGAVKQLWHNHVLVSPAVWTKLNLPAPETVPNLSLEVINFHRPLLGTFHQKALIVDRKIALLNSNNIQDRPNVEMMVHIEGPVVDSLYDTLLISWHESLNPKLPCLASPSPNSDPTKPFDYTFSDENPYLEHIDVAKAAKAARLLLSRQNQANQEAQLDSTDTSTPAWWQAERHPDGAHPHQAAHRPQGGGGFANLVQHLVERAKEEKARAMGEVYHPPPSTVMANAAPAEAGREELELTAPPSEASGPSTLVEPASPNAAVSPTLLAPGSPGSPSMSPEELAQRVQSKGSVRLQALSKSLNAGALAKIEAAIQDESLIDDFKPHMLHKPHEPFPIALVNRRPHGAPGHNDFRVPQAAAWLAALRHAEKDVFIQTPTLNAAPIVRGVIEACSRGGKDKKGIPVTMILGLGFNDKGESVPFQGGTNEEVVFRLYKRLNKLNKQHNLHVFWYTGKDQMKPLNAVHKSRNCHVKFMSVDGQCAIVGNGNLDTQSFMHSQETNILIDDPQIVADWMDQLRTNQSTEKYGRVDTDGIWRDQVTGERLAKPESVSCFTAVWAMIGK